MPNYDIFISYRSKNKVWVETLARNLRNEGYKIFLDIWELIPGQNFTQQIYNALKNSKTAILVASPDAVESGWVREEYELMFNRKQQMPDFRFFPVVFNENPDFPFLCNSQIINFSIDDYTRAYYFLLCGLKSVGPGDSVPSYPYLEIPAKLKKNLIHHNSSIEHFLQRLFALFEQSCPSPVMLLAQADRNQSPVVDAVLKKAEAHYSPARCLHILPPFSNQAEHQADGYFHSLGQQCGFGEGVKNGVDFEHALRDLLKTPNPLFLLVSRFEHGAENIRQELAGILRSLNESHANQLHIVLCGGEKLQELKFLKGSHSLLNIAHILLWPELIRADVYGLRDECCKTLSLTDEDVEQFLEISGGHPTLLQSVLLLRQDEPDLSWADYPMALSEDAFVWQLFTPYTRQPEQAKQVYQWLAHNDISPAKPFILNALLRHLYWRNLLVEKRIQGRKRLCWRCEALRLAGREILAEYV